MGRSCHERGVGRRWEREKCEVEIEGEGIHHLFSLEGSWTLTTSFVEIVPSFIATQLIYAHCSLRGGAKPWIGRWTHSLDLTHLLLHAHR